MREAELTPAFVARSTLLFVVGLAGSKSAKALVFAYERSTLSFLEPRIL
jgi:hypothetical protein